MKKEPLKAGTRVWVSFESSALDSLRGTWTQVTVRSIQLNPHSERYKHGGAYEGLMDDGDPENPNPDTNGWCHRGWFALGSIRRRKPPMRKDEVWKEAHERFTTWRSTPEGQEILGRLKALRDEERTLLGNLRIRFAPVDVAEEQLQYMQEAPDPNPVFPANPGLW